MIPHQLYEEYFDRLDELQRRGEEEKMKKKDKREGELCKHCSELEEDEEICTYCQGF